MAIVQIVHEKKLEMNNSLVRLVLIALLLMLVVAPFAGLVPLMIILLGFGVCWFFGSLVQTFFTADIEQDEKKA